MQVIALNQGNPQQNPGWTCGNVGIDVKNQWCVFPYTWDCGSGPDQCAANTPLPHTHAVGPDKDVLIRYVWDRDTDNMKQTVSVDGQQIGEYTTR